MIKFLTKVVRLKKNVNISQKVFKRLSNSLKMRYKLKDIILQQANEEPKNGKKKTTLTI